MFDLFVRGPIHILDVVLIPDLNFDAFSGFSRVRQRSGGVSHD